MCSNEKIAIIVLFVLFFPLWLFPYIAIQTLIYPIYVTCQTYAKQGCKFPIYFGSVPGFPFFVSFAILTSILCLPYSLIIAFKDLYKNAQIDDGLTSFFWPNPHPVLNCFTVKKGDRKFRPLKKAAERKMEENGKASMLEPAKKEAPFYYNSSQGHKILSSNESLTDHNQNKFSFGGYTPIETPQFAKFNSNNKNIEVSEGLKAVLLE